MFRGTFRKPMGLTICVTRYLLHNHELVLTNERTGLLMEHSTALCVDLEGSMNLPCEHKRIGVDVELLEAHFEAFFEGQNQAMVLGFVASGLFDEAHKHRTVVIPDSAVKNHGGCGGPSRVAP